MDSSILRNNRAMISFMFLLIPFVIFTAHFVANFTSPYQQYSEQSWSFLHGRLDIPLQHDTATFNGKSYWPEGPFPSIIIMPFQVVFGQPFYQGNIQIILIAVISVLLYRLARLKGFGWESAFFLIAAFFMSSPAIWPLTVPAVWFYGQVVAMALSLGVLYEWQTRKRFWLLGLLLSALWATRPPAGFILFPIIFFAATQYRSLELTVRKLTGFLTPLAITAILLLWFNYARFDNPFDNGYWNNDVGASVVPLRQLGMFSLNHLPMNIYWYFFASYERVTDGTAHLVFPFITYNPWGLSFVLIAPFFLYALRSFKKRDIITRAWWLTIAAILVVDMTYYNTGYTQFGPRYTADFLPILYLLLLQSFIPPNLNKLHKTIIIASSFVNGYLLLTPSFIS